MPLKQGPSNVKTVNLPKNPNDEDQENKIEFENKKIDESSKQVDFAKTFHELDAKAANTVKETENTNNVYLQVCSISYYRYFLRSLKKHKYT